jgi:hypothetical protein
LTDGKVYNLSEEVNSILLDEITNEGEANFVWDANLMDHSSGFKFVIDLNNDQSFFGLKEVKGQKFADWGLSKCNGNGCTIVGDQQNDFSYWPDLYTQLKNIPYYNANIVFRLSNQISYHHDSATLPIKLIGSKQADSPFPQGDFMTYLRKSYKWKDDKVTIKINPLKLDNTKTGF